MERTTEFHDSARRYYEACFGPESDRAKRYQALRDAEERDDQDTVEELRDAEADDVLSVEQLTHGLRSSCQWEILLTTGGPAARVVINIVDNEMVTWAEFQYQDWFQSWYAPEGQDHDMLADWADANFAIHSCRFCEEEGR